jgi:hypothetical protein
VTNYVVEVTEHLMPLGHCFISDTVFGIDASNRVGQAMRDHSGSIKHVWFENFDDNEGMTNSAWQALKGGLATLTNLQSLKINGIWKTRVSWT